jgi:hypothetical protein
VGLEFLVDLAVARAEEVSDALDSGADVHGRNSSGIRAFKLQVFSFGEEGCRIAVRPKTSGRDSPSGAKAQAVALVNVGPEGPSPGALTSIEKGVPVSQEERFIAQKACAEKGVLASKTPLGMTCFLFGTWTALA